MQVHKLQTAWIELYELQGNTAVKLSKWIYKSGSWNLLESSGVGKTSVKTWINNHA